MPGKYAWHGIDLAMDLRVIIIDENNDVLKSVEVYGDGSDSEAADSLVDMVRSSFDPDDEGIVSFPDSREES